MLYENSIFTMTEPNKMLIPPLAIPVVLSDDVDQTFHHLAVSKFIHKFDGQKVWLQLGKSESFSKVLKFKCTCIFQMVFLLDYPAIMGTYL